MLEVSMTELTGAKEMQQRIALINTGLKPEVGDALYAELVGTELPEIQKRTPYRYGNLRDSERVEEPQISPEKVAVFVLCGGPEAPYAIIVHEDLTAHHAIGQAKFMESVLMEAASTILGRVASRISFQRAMERH